MISLSLYLSLSFFVSILRRIINLCCVGEIPWVCGAEVWEAWTM